ncbi:MAG: hypothetical protein RL284_5 [Bacteroidota bacterium]|jgi:hypothetical protein
MLTCDGLAEQGLIIIPFTHLQHISFHLNDMRIRL